MSVDSPIFNSERGERRIVVSSSARERDLAWADLRDGMRRWELWSTLARQDIWDRYRRSLIGPFWLTISMGAFIGMLSFVYAGLFNLDLQTYIPYVATSFIVWSLISTLLLEGCHTFIQVEGVIKQARLPFFLHVFRVVWRNLIIFAHNIAIYLFVILWFGLWPGWVGLLAIPALAVLTLNAIWIALLFGLISARFRDIPQITAIIVQMMFLLTPIVWKKEILPQHASFVPTVNPFYHYLEIMRAPMLGEFPSTTSWLIVCVLTVIGVSVSAILFSRYRRRLAYWL